MRRLSGLVIAVLLTIILVVGPVIPSAYGVAAAPKKSTITVSTAHMSVQLTFPYSADPGQAISVSAAATANSHGRMIRFSIDIFSYVNGQLVRLASETIVTDTMVRVGDNWQAWLPLVVPANAQPGPLIGRATEVWQETSYYYYYGPVAGSSYCYQDRNYYLQNYYMQNWQQQNCYPQNYYQNYPPNYACYTYDTYSMQGYLQPGNRIITVRTPPQSYTQRWVYEFARMYQPSYVCQPMAYYGPDYARSYAGPISSQQTFPLTYVSGYYPS